MAVGVVQGGKNTHTQVGLGQRVYRHQIVAGGRSNDALFSILYEENERWTAE